MNLMSHVLADRHPRSNPDLLRRITLCHGNLVEQQGVEAIVSTIDPALKAEGSLNEAVMAAAGEDLPRFIRENIYRPRPGDAFRLPTFGLPFMHLIYVVVPPWRDGLFREDKELVTCYRQVIELAHKMKIKKLGIPALGTGKGGFPLPRAARLAMQGILDRVTPGIEEIRIVCARADVHETFAERLKKS